MLGGYIPRGIRSVHQGCPVYFWMAWIETFSLLSPKYFLSLNLSRLLQMRRVGIMWCPGGKKFPSNRQTNLYKNITKNTPQGDVAFLAMKIFRNATFRGFHGVELLHLISKTKRTEKEQSINTMISTSQSRTVSLSLAPQPTVEQCRGVSFSPIVSTSKSRKYLLRIRVINSQNWRTDSTT